MTAIGDPAQRRHDAVDAFRAAVARDLAALNGVAREALGPATELWPLDDEVPAPQGTVWQALREVAIISRPMK